jgi:DUF1365 family protein
MEKQAFRVTEYVAPLILVLVIAAGIGWLAMRLWREAAQARPDSRPGVSDYRFTPTDK